MQNRRHLTIAFVCCLLLSASAVRAEYYGFDVARGSDIITQEVRYPAWAESTYDAFFTGTILGPGKTGVYCYSGVPNANPADPVRNPAAIIWSFWPVSNPLTPGDTVKVAWCHPQMYAPLAVGEGASGKASGQWPQLKPGAWYQVVHRVWPAAEATASYAGEWLRDSADGHWYHLATMRLPFRATGYSGLGGFLEDFGHGNRNPRRVEFRHVYYHDGAWKPAPNFTPSVRQKGEKGRAELIENGTAAYYETCSGPSYTGTLDFDQKNTKVTLTLTQPAQPELAAPTVEQVAARTARQRVLVTWQVPATASPQYGYRAEALDAAGKVVGSAAELDPEARQALVETGGATVHGVRLTLTDVFDQMATATVVPQPLALQPATAAAKTVPGLDFAYYEAGDAGWSKLPDFAALKPVLSGAANGPDLTLRRSRFKYALAYHGYLRVPTDGLYGFHLDSYDGSRLILDDATVIDLDGIHSYTGQSGAVALAAGLHPVQVQYFRDTDRGEGCTYADRLSLEWEGPKLPRQAVPLEAFQRKPAPGEPLATTSVAAHTQEGERLEVTVKPGASPVRRVAWYVGDTLWAARDAAPFTTTTVLPLGELSLRARVFTTDGHAYDTPPVAFTSRQAASAGWALTQMQAPHKLLAAAGTADTVSLAGDGLILATKPAEGDVTLVAHVAQRPQANQPTQDDGTRPEGQWLGGIMLRDDLLDYSTSLGHLFCTFYARVDGTTHLQSNLDHNPGGPVPGPNLGRYEWLKLERRGDTFTAFGSKDGQTWEERAHRVIPMPKSLQAGLCIQGPPGYNPNVNAWRFDAIALTPR